MSTPRERMDPRAAAREVAVRLKDAGHRALFAGGCVRDRLLGGAPEDFDIATSATPEEIVRVFPKARGVGEAFGVMLVRHGGNTFEVATFRKDGPYKDGRRPSEVTFSDEREDALRRDFTVNGIFQDPESGEPVDYVEGRKDIEARVIRAIGDPHARIAEDRLRMLRAVRFAARLGFAVEPATSDAIRTHAGELMSVSPERVGEELRKMLAHPARARAAALAEEHHLDTAVFGRHNGPDELPRLTALPAETAWTTALAAWLLDRLGRGVTYLPRMPRAAVPMFVPDLRTRLVLSNHETDAIEAIFAAREAMFTGYRGQPLAARKRLMAAPGFDAALSVLRGEDPSAATAIAEEADRELPERRLPAPLLDGAALLAEGLRAGPEFKVLLDLAMDAQLEGRISSRDEALALVRAHRSGSGGGRP